MIGVYLWLYFIQFYIFIWRDHIKTSCFHSIWFKINIKSKLIFYGLIWISFCCYFHYKIAKYFYDKILIGKCLILVCTLSIEKISIWSTTVMQISLRTKKIGKAQINVATLLVWISFKTVELPLVFLRIHVPNILKLNIIL